MKNEINVGDLAKKISEHLQNANVKQSSKVIESSKLSPFPTPLIDWLRDLFLQKEVRPLGEDGQKKLVQALSKLIDKGDEKDTLSFFIFIFLLIKIDVIIL